MITHHEVKQAERKEKLVSERFLRGIVDFLKWTSSFTVGALLWVGSSLDSKTGASFVFSIVCLVFLAISLALAVWTVRLVLMAWGSKWAEADALNSFYSMKQFKHYEPNKLSEEKEKGFIDQLLHATNATRPFSKPHRFSTWVTWHTGLLLMGLLFYITAQLWR